MLSGLMILANECYSNKKFAHAMRVGSYAYDAAKFHTEIKPEDALMVGIAHDLLEDTDIPIDALQEVLTEEQFEAVWILTKDDNQDYEDYIESIINSNNKLAFIVKKADLKDHMSQMDTLTKKLQKKYLPILHCFL